MVDHQLESLKSVHQILAGGDTLSVSHVQRVLGTFHENQRLINGYGPTENTTFTCCHVMTAGSQVGSSVPIGRPIANTEVYVLDQALVPVPIGVFGELYIGGDGLAQGYVNQPGLTAEKFVPHPFSFEPGMRLYRSGDVVRYRVDGTIEFRGRVDHQVKIRGFRIEVGEIESRLLKHSNVEDGVVLCRGEQGDDKELVAYVVPKGDSQPSIQDLRAFLKQTLPDYMVPTSIMILESLPLGPTGKVNRQKLPAPDFFRTDTKGVVTPNTPVEEALANMWGSLLQVDQVGIDDNFFDLGGHSLLAVKLLAQIEQQFGTQLPLSVFLQAPTIEQLAGLLISPDTPTIWSTLVPIKSQGTQPPLFCSHAGKGEILWYRIFVRHLSADQPLYALQRSGQHGSSSFHLQTRLEDIVRPYTAAVRAHQPEGPYRIMGRCLGGSIAFELARQLIEQGQEISLLVILDSGPPGAKRLVEKNPAGRVETPLRWRRMMQVMYHFLWRLGLKGRFRREAILLFGSAKEQQAWREGHAYQEAADAYVAHPLPCKITLIRCESTQKSANKDLDLIRWRSLAGHGLETYTVPGDHISMLKEPLVGDLGAQLQACLDKAKDYVSSKPPAS